MFFLGMTRRVFCLEVGVVVCTCFNLVVVWCICCDRDPVSGILEDGNGGVAGIGAFEGYLEADVEEVLFERDDMAVFWCACKFRVIVADLREEAGDFDDGCHGDYTGVGGEGARWFLGGASVGVAVRGHAGLSVPGLAVQRLGSECRWDLSWSYRSGTWLFCALDANGVGMSVGFGL